MMPLPSACPWPAIRDAIQVPCTPQAGLVGGVATPVRSGPVSTEPARSETSGLTPLSMTATTTPLPCVTLQAGCTLSSFRTHISVLRTASALAGAAGTTAAAEKRHSRQADNSRDRRDGPGQHPGAPGHTGVAGRRPSTASADPDRPCTRLSISWSRYWSADTRTLCLPSAKPTVVMITYGPP